MRPTLVRPTLVRPARRTRACPRRSRRSPRTTCGSTRPTTCSASRRATTASQCRAFLAALAETPHAEVVALGAPALAAVEAEYRACTPFPARFAPAAGWDGGARALAVRAQSNASILGHWLLRDYPEEVAVLLWPARDGVQRASLRSRTLCIPDALPWARGHAHACAGRLPADVAERLRRDSI